jgi:hypothetical protein
VNRRALSVATLILLTASLTQGFAQAPPSRPLAPAPAQPLPADPKACAPGERLQLEEDLPREPATTGEAISEKLARTHGVICPPTVDSDIKAPTPPGGTIRVIPAPGTPGGDPTVRPK